MAHADAAAIRKFVQARGIEALVHFTRVTNVPGILEHGLLGRETLVRRGLQSRSNDNYRYDGAPDAVCASVSFPNYKMFYALQKRNPDADWAVLRINPAVLWEQPCAFCTSNAAASTVTSIPLVDRMGLAALEAMFGEVRPDVSRAQLRIPESYTTDPQAEVLILAPVEPGYVHQIGLNISNTINNFEEMRQAIEPLLKKANFEDDASLFTYRKDYEYWRRPDAPTVDFDDFEISF